MQRVVDLTTEPEVGKFYLVPCVLDRRGEWVPVVGPPHEDSEYIEQPATHYHLDVRFVSGRDARRFASEFLRKVRTAAAPGQLAMSVVVTLRSVCGGPTEKVFKCKRVMPDFPNYVGGVRIPEWLPALEGAYAGQKMTCLRCPHRGMDLKSLPVKDGVVVCNGHGLAWNVNTGEMVKRV